MGLSAVTMTGRDMPRALDVAALETAKALKEIAENLDSG